MNITIQIPDHHLVNLPQYEIEEIIETLAKERFNGAIVVYQVYPGLVNAPKVKARANDQREVVDFCLQQQLTEDDAGYFWDRMQVTDWRINKQPIKDWKAAVRTWRRQGYFPSQKQPLRANTTAGYDQQFPTG